MSVSRGPKSGMMTVETDCPLKTLPARTAHAWEAKMTTMRSLAIIALLIGGTSPALAQNAPPTDGYPPPAAGTSGNPATYGPPGPAVIPGAPGPPFHSSAPRYETSHSVLIAPLTEMQAGPRNVTLVHSHQYRHAHQYIVIPLTRQYRPYWWPQGQYHWSPFGLERWGYWCEGAGSHWLSC